MTLVGILARGTCIAGVPGSPLAALSPRTKFASAPYALISGDSWSLLGNASTIPGTKFIGTTDSQPLEFKVNNIRGFRLEPTSVPARVVTHGRQCVVRYFQPEALHLIKQIRGELSALATALG